MITFSQITASEEIASLEDYFVLDVETDGSDPVSNPVQSVAMLQISELLIVNEASVRISDSDGGVSARQIAGSLARLLFDSVLIAEPETVVALRVLLERYDLSAEIRFIPLTRLVSACFPGLEDYSYEALASRFSLIVPDADHDLLHPLLADAIFRQCRAVLVTDEDTASVSVPDETDTGSGKHTGSPGSAVRKHKLSGRKHSAGAVQTDVTAVSEKAAGRPKKKRRRFTDKELKRMEERIWTISPWSLLLVGLILLILVAVMLPRGEDNSVVDLEKAPNSYLVLSWNETGKYGTQPRDKDAPIEFRIPYGVYNVLNNNSIPVEVTITDEAVLRELAAKQKKSSEGEEDEEVTGVSSVTIRPSTQREIIIDTDQHLTLSEDASKLIFFYVSEVPEVLLPASPLSMIDIPMRSDSRSNFSSTLLPVHR